MSSRVHGKASPHGAHPIAVRAPSSSAHPENEAVARIRADIGSDTPWQPGIRGKALQADLASMRETYGLNVNFGPGRYVGKGKDLRASPAFRASVRALLSGMAAQGARSFRCEVHLPMDAYQWAYLQGVLDETRAFNKGRRAPLKASLTVGYNDLGIAESEIDGSGLPSGSKRTWKLLNVAEQAEVSSFWHLGILAKSQPGPHASAGDRQAYQAQIRQFQAQHRYARQIEDTMRAHLHDGWAPSARYMSWALWALEPAASASQRDSEQRLIQGGGYRVPQMIERAKAESVALGHRLSAYRDVLHQLEVFNEPNAGYWPQHWNHDPGDPISEDVAIRNFASFSRTVVPAMSKALGGLVVDGAMTQVQLTDPVDMAHIEQAKANQPHARDAALDAAVRQSSSYRYLAELMKGHRGLPFDVNVHLYDNTRINQAFIRQIHRLAEQNGVSVLTVHVTEFGNEHIAGFRPSAESQATSILEVGLGIADQVARLQDGGGKTRIRLADLMAYPYHDSPGFEAGKGLHGNPYLERVLGEGQDL